MHQFSNRSQKVSKCDNNIRQLMCHFFVLTTLIFLMPSCDPLLPRCMATQNLVVDLARSVALPSGVKFLHELAKNYEWQSKKTVDNHGKY